ncbi:MAG: CotH kinase family protein [Myxococcota bacterium]
MIALLVACGPGRPVGEDLDLRDAADEVAGEAPDDGEAPPEDNAFLFERVHTIELELDDEALAGLATAPDQDVDDVRARFTLGEESYRVGLRLRGGENSFRTIEGKPGFRVDFNEFVEDQEFHGLRALTLLNMVQDPSMIAEHVTFRLYDAVGLVAPRHGYARVFVNGTDYGLYGLVEPVDEAFVDARWEGEDGPVFEGDNADLVATDLARFSTDVEERAPLDALVATLDTTTADVYLPTVDDLFGPDMALKHVAVDLVTGNADAYTTRVNNWFLYYEVEAGRWWTMPWGLDRAMRTDLDVTSLYRGRLYQDCWASTACAARFRVIVEDVLLAWEAIDLTGYAEDVATTIYDDCVNDPRGPGGCEIDQPAVLAWIAARPGVVRGQLGESR